MWLSVENHETTVKRYTEAELAWLDAYLGMPDDKARFRRRGSGSGRRPLLNLFLNTFPTGLLPVVLEGAREAKPRPVDIELIDLRTRPCKPDPTADLSWIFDYQEEAVEVCYEKGRGVIHAPTGAGKTEIHVALALVLPCRWGVLVPAKSLLEEVASRYEARTGMKAGRIGDGICDVQKFTVATFQSVYARLCKQDPTIVKWLRSLDAIMVDECHTLPADSFWQVAMAAVNAYYRFGTSATPFARGDRKGLLAIAALGPTIYRIRQDVLVEKGTIAAGKITLASHPIDRKTAIALSKDNTDYVTAYSEAIVYNPARNRRIVELAKSMPKPGFVFVRELEHGKMLTDMLTQSDVPAEFVWGQKSTEQRQAAVRRLEHGDTDIIVCNVVFRAGVNVPSLQSVLNAAGGKSHITTLQQAGRGSRRLDKFGKVVKDEFTVIDVTDQNCGCKTKGHDGKAHWKHKVCEWADKHSRSRRRAYLNEGYAITES